jgi:hypothetical protein
MCACSLTKIPFSAMEIARMLNIQPTKEEEHIVMLLQRVRHGRVKELRYWAGAYLNSFDAKQQLKAA